MTTSEQRDRQRLWHRHCLQLERRAAITRDPLAVARLHHQRGFVQATLLGDTAAAIQAWLDGLAAWPGHVPTLIALRDAALATDDQPLARRLFDAHLDVLNRPGAEARDAAELYTFFAWIWLLRWPDADRAAVAVRRLDALAPDGDGDVLAPLALPTSDQILRLERRLEAGRTPERLTALVELSLRSPRPGDLRPLLAEAAGVDPYAATRWVEHATSVDDARGRAEALEALARFCGPYKPVLRFLAGELWDLLVDDATRARAAFASTAEVAVDRMMRVKEAIRAARPLSRPGPLAEVLAALADDVGEDAVFAGCLRLRAAALQADAGDDERAWALSTAALATLKTLPAARLLVARLGCAITPGGPWPTPSPASRRPRGAACALPRWSWGPETPWPPRPPWGASTPRPISPSCACGSASSPPRATPPSRGPGSARRPWSRPASAARTCTCASASAPSWSPAPSIGASRTCSGCSTTTPST
ncbi:MAG: hypothetical protein R3F60_03630 [bacterium]